MTDTTLDDARLDYTGRVQILSIGTYKLLESQNPEKFVIAIAWLGEIADRTENFTLNEILALLRAASSHSYTRRRGNATEEGNFTLEYRDFERALNDIEPKFGSKSEELKTVYRKGFVAYGDGFNTLMGTMFRLVEQVRTSEKTELMSVLLQGDPLSGKTAVAAKVAVESGFPFVRVISADDLIGQSESSKCQHIHKAFLDSYKSSLSLIIIDNIERIIDYTQIGPRFSNLVLQTLLVLLKKVPPGEERRLFVIGTTSIAHHLEELVKAFSLAQKVPLLEEPDQVKRVLQEAAHMSESDSDGIANKAIAKPIGVKKLLQVAEMALHRSQKDGVDVGTFLECLGIVGY